MQYNLMNILVHLVVDPGNAPHDADEAVGVVPVQGVPVVQSKNKGTLSKIQFWICVFMVLTTQM